MSQTLDPFPRDQNNSILCCYVNATSQIQIARITNIPNWYFERVVFPGQRLVFEAHENAVIEIHSGMMASAILSDTIPCIKLKLKNAQDQSKAQKVADIGQTGNISLGKMDMAASVRFAV
ncbi:MAG: DUF1830 domain-containing protein [Pleurocapsa sp. CRU_1_2]|nr:DUF1830 domain-containing protein [Pleurocapsa sp. CRU_1_2]